jgi:hypothetical protein
VPEFGVTVAASNFDETALEMTRDDAYRPGEPQKAFLSYLSRAMLAKVFEIPRTKWLTILDFLGRMGRERHLQLFFEDPRLEDMAARYGVTGNLTPTQDDSMLVADTSVNSTKLNLILRPKIDVVLNFPGGDTVQSSVTYTLFNPIHEWAQGRDPRLVSALMLEGVYGSYTRLYASPNAMLRDVLIDQKPAGPEQISDERGRTVFGRFFPVLPGGNASVTFEYDTPGVVRRTGSDIRYRLDIQKEAGTDAIPLRVTARPPAGASSVSLWLDGKQVQGNVLASDLRTDRTVEVRYRIQ